MKRLLLLFTIATALTADPIIITPSGPPVFSAPNTDWRYRRTRAGCRERLHHSRRDGGSHGTVRWATDRDWRLGDFVSDQV